MFYGILFAVFAVLIGLFCVLKWTAFKNNEKFDVVMTKILKVTAVVYCFVIFFTIFLPDNFTRSWGGGRRRLANK